MDNNYNEDKVYEFNKEIAEISSKIPKIGEYLKTLKHLSNEFRQILTHGLQMSPF